MRISTHVKANHHCTRSNRQVHIALAHAAHACVHHLHFDFVGTEFEQRGRQRLLRTLHIGLDDDGQLLDLARLHIGEHVFQLGRLLLGQLGIAELAATVSGNFAGTALVCQYHELVTGLRHFSQTLNFHGNGRPCRFGRTTVFVVHGTHAAPGLTSQYHIARFERTGLDQHGRNRATAFVQLGFHHQALGHGVYRRFQLQHFGLQQDVFEQFVNAHTRFAGYRDKW